MTGRRVTSGAADGTGRTGGTVFAFGGQGSQHPAMTARLYLGHARYRARLESAAEALGPYTSTSIIDLVMSGDARIRQTGFAQPALFAVEYALAATLVELGVRPAAVLGQGVGEFAAAVIAGALSLDDAAMLVATRGAFMHFLPSGGMLAVRDRGAWPHGPLGEALAQEPAVAVGAVNGPRDLVLSGEPGALERVRAALRASRVPALPLGVPHAFSSPLMEPMLGRYRRVLARTGLGAPRVSFYSTVRGRDLAGQILDADYWAEHATSPILFAGAAGRLLADGRPAAIVDLGPLPTLTALLRRTAAAGGRACPAVWHGAQGDAAAFNELAERLAHGRSADAEERWTTAAAA